MWSPPSARTSITLSEVDEKAMQQPAGNFGNMKLSQALYEARRAAVEDIIGEKLLAQESKTRGITSAALIDQEIGSKIATVTDADVAAWYNANPSRVQGAKLEQVQGADPIDAHPGTNRRPCIRPTSIS